MTIHQQRVHAGVSTSGQFAPDRHAPSPVHLNPTPPALAYAHPAELHLGRRTDRISDRLADGGGCVLIGSNSVNVKFDANVFNSVTSYGTVGLVQNTWRELKAGS